MSADTAPKIREYMTAHGWEQRTNGPAGGMWRHGGGNHVGVPDVIGYGSPGWHSVISRVAAAEARPVVDVTADVLGPGGWPLTCEFCRSAPAVRLVVADLAHGGKRTRNLICRSCAASVLKDTANPSFASALIFALTDVTGEYQAAASPAISNGGA